MTVSPTLDARFREAAAAAGLLDVAYDLADSPIGTLLVAATDRGLCRISYDPSRSARRVARESFGVRVLRVREAASTRRGASSTSTSRASAREFDLPLDLRRVAAVQQRRCSASSPASRTARSRRTARSPRGRTTPGRPRGRRGHEPQPDPDRPPVPPCRRRKRLARRLRRRPRAQGAAAQARRRARSSA